MKNIVVVGAGITGLSAAYYLNKEIQTNKLPYQVVLVEATDRLGGKIQTIYRDGFVVEQGPDSWLAPKVAITNLIKDVGLGDQLVHSKPGAVLVCAENELHSMPGGSFFGVPVNTEEFLKAELISEAGKNRAVEDLDIPQTEIAPDEDIAMGAFFRRRLGDEMVNKLIEPLIAGIFAGNLDKMSMRALFPDFLNKEQEHGSLIAGMRAGIKAQQERAAKAPSKERPQGMPFVSVATGMTSVVQAIIEAMPEVQILKGNKVLDVVQSGERTYRIQLADGQSLHAESIVVATNHQAIPALFSGDESLRFFEEEMHSNSVVSVTMAFKKSAVKKDFDGASFIVSRTSDYGITACAWLHKKWDHVAPEDSVLVRAYVGKTGGLNDAMVGLSDAALEEIVLREVGKQVEFDGAPIFSIVNRWRESMPQYSVGHKQRVAEMREKVALDFPGVFFTGSPIDGIGMSDCVRQAKETSDEVLEFMGK